MTIWKKFKALLAGIELNRKVPRHPAHLWYALLTFFCIPAALVMHGHVHFTMAVMMLLIPVALLAYIPYRYCNILSRMVLNACIFGAGCFWLAFRLKHNVPLDKMMVETLALWSLTFLSSGKSKGYFYLLFIDILLLLYAALLPRLLSLYLTIAAFGVLLVILFRNRVGFLSGDMLLDSPRRSFRKTWHFCLIWLIITGLAFHFVFGIIPLTDNGLEGLIPVSFTTEKESFASPDLKEWLKSGKNVKNTPDSKEIREDAVGENTALSKETKGKARGVSLPKPPPDTPVVPGDGGSSMGKDLVFRVKSPLKLYHLARLYDQYDGANWSVSRSMRRNSLRGHEAPESQQIKLSYAVEKLFSSTLAIPWRYTEFSLDEEIRTSLLYTPHFWGVELKKLPSKFPFKFTAQCALPATELSSDGTPKALPWQEYNPRYNYLTLPKSKISKRVRHLALSLTAPHKTPYAKALALRNFLRSNYTYKLHASPTPRHRESVDYFLFYLGEGHCEYFASALAVLARCAGLPSRVATGFSPGNYNTLTSLFEVYEYHAHAWTQIYIPEFGWLTFDATPPSAIVSETYPPGLGKMRDPFGDEWKIRPPELTDSALEYMQRIRINAERKKKGESNVEQALGEIAAAGDKLREELSKEEKKVTQTPPPKVVKGKIDLAHLRQKIKEKFRQFQTSLVDLALYVVSSWTRLLAATGLLFLGALSAVGLFVLLKRALRGVRFLILFRRSGDFRDPARAIRNSCRGALALLSLKGLPRKGNEELLAYASRLRPDLAEEAVTLFKLFYRAEYRSQAPGTAEAEKAAHCLKQLRSKLKHN